MVLCEHFIYGQFNGLGYRTIKSANLHQIISSRSLRHLKNLNGRSPIQTLLPEQVVAVTFLRNDTDEYGRKTMWNHTILISIQDYFNLNPADFFERYFIREMQNPYGTLKPLKVKTKCLKP